MYFTERWKRDRLDRCLGEVDAARHSSSSITRALAAAMHAQGSCASLARRLVQRTQAGLPERARTIGTCVAHPSPSHSC
jgi:hypothetical protein